MEHFMEEEIFMVIKIKKYLQPHQKGKCKLKLNFLLPPD